MFSNSRSSAQFEHPNNFVGFSGFKYHQSNPLSSHSFPLSNALSHEAQYFQGMLQLECKISVDIFKDRATVQFVNRY
jgi:hypothetical protein